jgi:hypothetical protein
MPVRLCLMLGVLGAFALHVTVIGGPARTASSARRRRLDSHGGGNASSSAELPICNFTQTSDFPDDLFTEEQRQSGAIVIHALVMLYMFVGLAIICDEYFEPSLAELCSKLDLKADVAGATFMAAGGSMPELATSFMGTFVARSDVGFGTIVGSATFNILFVIAACSWVGHGLQLTAWPLLRDSVFYCISIAVLVGFITDQVRARAHRARSHPERTARPAATPALPPLTRAHAPWTCAPARPTPREHSAWSGTRP